MHEFSIIHMHYINVFINTSMTQITEKLLFGVDPNLII